MITAIAPLTFPDAEPESRRTLTSPAVARCQQAWDRAYHETMKLRKGGALSHLDAGDAYRLAMPQLVGYDNICDFIACVAYAMVNGILLEDSGTTFLSAAKSALDALLAKPKLK